ncbi:MAG: HPr family phosphocarrier protein [Lachnospiraceae bacterium]|jgi:catabolite repression HPr-like protein|nr:HPr family phosphocarrier protein [Lachnospiraceae bacterium]
MMEKSIAVKMTKDLDARPIAMLVQVASRHESSVYLMAEGKKVNAKSIMGMMSLVLDNGEEVTIVTDGNDEEAAMESIVAFLTGKEE